MKRAVFVILVSIALYLCSVATCTLINNDKFSEDTTKINWQLKLLE